MMNFSARLPRGPPKEGPWNEVLILNRTTREEIRRVQNYAKYECTSPTPHAGESCQGKNFTVPIFCGFSASGNATGRPVFINYGRPEDLQFFNSSDKLCSLDIIVVARHGYNSYGSKVREVVSHCMKLGSNSLPGGMLIYRDPTDVPPDIKVYPEGVGLPSDGLAYRVSTMHSQGGDVETPGLPSIDGVYKIQTAEQVAVTPFPVQTINLNDAKVLIGGFGGAAIPTEWKPSSIQFMGPEGDNLIKMNVRNRLDEKPSTLVDVIGIMPGKGPEADKYVIIGNHRDAWIQGASDPHSGTAVIQGVAYLLGLAYKDGWRPKRSIVICSWDAEEVGLMGSTEFTELFHKELFSKALVYFNQDCPVKGNATFALRADQFLERGLLQSATAVQGPCNNSLNFLEEWATRNVKSNGVPFTVPIGGSTDHVPFQYQLGIPSTYPEFRPEPPLFEAPSYHTAYDNIDMAERFTDPPCPTSKEKFPLHQFLIRYHFHLMLRFSGSRRFPIFPIYKANTLELAWKNILNYTATYIPEIKTRFGIDLDYITGSIRAFKNAVMAFEKSFVDIERSKPHCLHVFNNILADLSKQFITNVNTTTPRHVLVEDEDVKSHIESYFPRLQKLLHNLNQSAGNETSDLITNIKIELSILFTAFTSASNHLKGGLLGSLDMVYDDLCPTHQYMTFVY
ncbi:unnamed protein product [Rodentolepis nana]|uniref:Peptidase_M28 domain-containing protein n=1 Tax=Rodentolepis nana TaxID=102285 RepID=A0A0R3TR56_RODNA|nr:unnamed protein product [Rodentolepis nana]